MGGAGDIVDRLAEAWQRAGVEPGDMLLLHSSAKRLMRRIAKEGGNPSPELIIESFLAALGPGGTLLLPLFNFDFTSGAVFDIRRTPSQMGAISEAGRRWPGAVRTGHPIYSFAAIGAASASFAGLENFSGYGADSPFGMLHRAGGKIAVLDLPDNNSMTFYHYVEEACSVPYRYHKRFTGPYVDSSGEQALRTFGLYVRDIEKGVMTEVDPMGELLWERGLYHGERPREGYGLRTISAAPMYDEVRAVIEQGKALGLLYAIER
jgi:aminoglycoside 3-N-acetyltransferase